MKKVLGLSLGLLSIYASAEIGLSKNIEADKKEILNRDIEALKSIKFEGATSKAYKIFFKSENLDGEVLNSWLNERVQFIMEQDFLKPELISVIGPMGATKQIDKSNGEIEDSVMSLKGKNLADPDTYRDLGINVNNEIAESGDDSGVVMSNTGTALYYLGKSNGFVLGLQVETDEASHIVPISSPRSGIIEIGPVLFANRYLINKKEKEAAINSYNRAATLLHEARHSDGNEASGSLGFFHNDCPDFHDLKGMAACDFNGNGPYAIGGVFMYETAKKCTDCKEEEKAGLLARAYDSFSRVMKVNNSLKILDETPEGTRLENR